MRTIVIYSGRFQPFGPHHFKSYKWLCQAFGSGNVFICTSNHQDLNSPLTFNEKLICISKYNIAHDHIVEVKNPYRSDELIQRFNPNTTSVIFGYGEKDFGRIKFNKIDGSPSYLKHYYGQKDLEPLSTSGYAVDIPNQTIKHNGREINGTYLREVLPMSTQAEFTQLMGYYDQDIHFLFKKKFHPDITELTETIFLSEGDITRTQLQRIEQYADQLFKSYGIDINFQNLLKGTHFWHRVNDPRNGKPITADELRQLFRKASIKFGDKLSKSPEGLEAVLKDMQTDINLPFIIKFDSQNKELDLVPKTIMRKKDFKSSTPILAVESAPKKFTKHICHLYEDKTLTKDDYFDFIDALLIHPEKLESCSLKYDGHNFKVTFKNGQIKCARSKSTIIEPMSKQELFQKYDGKPDVQFTFTKAMEDVGTSLLRLGTEKLNEIFKNGSVFLNFEILHQKAKNVFDYGQPMLSLHSLHTYDSLGQELTQTTDLPFELQHGRIFKIQKTPAVTLQPLNDPTALRFIQEQIQSGQNLKETILLLENLVIQNFCNTNPNLGNSKDLVDIINSTKGLIQTEDDRKKYDEGMRLIEFIGGMEQINPIEGLVFKYKGNTWKCSGFFGCSQPILNVHHKYRFPKK